MCRFFEVSRSGYYDYLHRKDIPDRDLPLANLIKECQEQITEHTDTEEYKYGLKDKGYTEIQRLYYE